MAAMLDLTRSEYSVVWLPTETSVVPTMPRSHQAKKEPSSRKRPAPEIRDPRSVARFLVAICIGVIATLTWQSYSNAARQLAAGSSSPLGSLAAEISPGMMVRAAFAVVPSSDQPDFVTLRQGIDRLATSQQRISASFLELASAQDQLASTQQEMMRDITRLQQTERHVVSIVSVPLPRPAPIEMRRHPSRLASKAAGAGSNAHHAVTSYPSVGSSSPAPAQSTRVDTSHKRMQSYAPDLINSASEPLGRNFLIASRTLMSAFSRVTGIQL
jgi:hypothetical protein